MGDDLEFVGVRMPEDHVAEIEARAEATESTKSEVIRDIVARELGEELLMDRVERLEDTVELFEDALEVLLEDAIPAEHVEQVNSPHFELLRQLRDGEGNS